MAIKLDPKKKGTFTKYCKAKGHKGVTSKCIAEGKKSKNKTTKKRAVFADNAKKWKKK
jgi:hypothetical protein